ncbi:hypothetical protein AB0P21_40955 [Kribbella sp. NPDC056861]|uniref:hypothetical protein n=1 Tax=Kribbella sp. NPDC056861 TaxID=3154857 RepID=UPI00341CCF79
MRVTKVLSCAVVLATVTGGLVATGAGTAGAATQNTLTVCVRADLKVLVDIGVPDIPKVYNGQCLVVTAFPGTVLYTQTCNRYDPPYQSCEPYAQWRVSGTPATLVAVPDKGGNDRWHYKFLATRIGH